MKKITYGILLVSLLFGITLPFLAAAQTTQLPDVWSPTSLHGPLIVCTGAGPTGGVLEKNCSNLCDLVFQCEYIIYLLIAFAIWIVAPVSFIIGGVMYMLAGAKHEMLSQAKKMLLGTVIGVVIILCAYLIIYTVVHLLNIAGIGGFGAGTCTIH